MPTILEIQKPELTYCQKWDLHCPCIKCEGENTWSCIKRDMKNYLAHPTHPTHPTHPIHKTCCTCCDLCRGPNETSKKGYFYFGSEKYGFGSEKHRYNRLCPTKVNSKVNVQEYKKTKFF